MILVGGQGHCLFKDKSCYKKKDDYGKMMDMLCSYTVAGRNRHDDVPDGFAMLSEYAQSLVGNKVEIFQGFLNKYMKRVCVSHALF